MRLIYIYEISDTPLFTVPVVDAKTYVDDAIFLSQQSWLGYSAPFGQSLLYPYFIAILFKFAGINYLLPRLIQALLGGAISSLVYLIGCKLFTKKIAIGAALATVFYGPLIYFGGELLPPILATFLILLLVLVLLQASSERWGGWFVAGVLLALSTLAVAHSLFLAPVLLFWLWQGQKQQQWSSSLVYRQAGLILAGCSLVLVPIGVRNYVVEEGGTGQVAYEGPSPIQLGQEWTELVERSEDEEGSEQRLPKALYFFGSITKEIRFEPLQFLERMGRAVYYFWHGDERVQQLDPYYARHDSRVLHWMLWKHGLAFPFGLVAPLALMGLVVFWRSPQGRNFHGRLFLYFILSSGFFVVLLGGISRYRLPVVPLLLLLAVYGLVHLIKSGWYWRLAFIPLFLLANINSGTMVMEGSAQQHCWLGYAYEKQGMQANAEREYRTALKIRPNHANALLYLAASRLARQDVERALELYLQYLRYYPEDDKVRLLLANTYLGVRRYDEALVAYEQIAVRQKEWADLYGRIGYANLMAGQSLQAITAYRRTLALKPDTLVVRYQLARLYQAENKIDSALSEFDTLLMAAPGQAEYHFRKADLLVRAVSLDKITMKLEQNPLLDQAKQHYLEAMELDESYIPPRWGLGMLLARLTHYEAAIPYFEQIIALVPRDYQAHLFLGHLLQRLGRTDAAENHFKRYSDDQKKYKIERQAWAGLESQIEKLFDGKGRR